MKRTAVMCALTLGLVACGGNPFVEETVEDTTSPDDDVVESTVPEAILGDLERISFNSLDNTLTVSGLTQDGVPLVNEYRHVAETFVPGFETFTGQNDPLGRHATALVASREGVQAGVVMTGGQFNTFFGGAFFERTSGTYEAPTAPEGRFDVTYHGNYAGTVNSAGPLTDLFDTTGLDPDVNTSTQTAYVQGLIFVNVDLNDMSVEGEIFDRTGTFSADADGFLSSVSLPNEGFLELPDLVFVDGTLNGDGTFNGDIEFDATDGNPGVPDNPVGGDIGDFAGVIGGPGGNAIAGGISLTEYDERLDDEVEFGVFVLDICTVTDTDPICVNAQQP